MAHPEDHPISQHPELKELQLAQFAVELGADEVEKLAIARELLELQSFDRLVGRYFGIEAGFAIGRSPDRSDKTRILYDDGITFVARSRGVGYDPDANIPVESIYIDFLNPRLMAEEGSIDEEMGRELAASGAPVLSYIRTRILDIRQCSIEVPRPALFAS